MNSSRTNRPLLLLFILILMPACGRQEELAPTATPPPAAQIQVLAEGFSNPVGLALLPDGGLLVAEEGTGEGDLSAGVSLITADGTIGRLVSGLPSSRDAGDLAGVPLVGVDPVGDKIYLAHFQFSDGHLLTLPLPDGLLDLPLVPYTRADLVPAMLPSGNVFLVNPFDITFDPEGRPVVSDASGNGVAKATPGGGTRFFHRFEQLTDPADPSL
ncbi:MAG: hypothetical protein R3264_19105, partial [Anaerolineae bacterium]|nr:hypothetical protein [Anaerolineae bacterium]